MKKIEIPIDEIILQPENAIIRRKGALKLAQGYNEIELINLDPELDSDTLNFMISAESVIIHSLNFETEEKNNDNNILEMKKKEKSLEEKISTLNSTKKTHEYWISFFKDFQEEFSQNFPNGYSTGKLTIDTLSDFIKYFEDQITGLNNEKNNIEHEIKLLNSEKSDLQNYYQKIRQDFQKIKMGKLKIILELSENEKNVDAQLEYILPKEFSKWAMFYEFELKNNDAILTKWATITNNSKETWENVKITLTDKIRSHLSIEEPKVPFIDPEKGVESEFLIPVQTTQLPRRVSFNKRSESKKFEINKVKLNSKRSLHYWNAADFNDVIEIAILSLKEEYLYPSEIIVFIDGVFINTITHTKVTSPGTEIGIPLKPNPKIMVSKKALDKNISEVGVINKQIVITYPYNLLITNSCPYDVQLVVYERIPEPVDLPKTTSNQNESVMKKIPIIALDKVSSKPYKVFKDGLVRWDLSIKPKGIESVDFKIQLVKEV